VASDSWTRDELCDLTHDFLAGRGAPARILALALSAGAAQHFDNLVLKTVGWFLDERARDTPVGKLHRHMIANLKKATGVAAAGKDTWVAVQHADAIPWDGLDDQLHAVAAGVVVVAPPYGPDSERQAPATTGASMQQLCAAVLVAAGGPVRTDTLLRVCAHRLAVHNRPELGFDDIHDDRRREPVETSAQPDDVVLASSAHTQAELVWDGLDDTERRLVPVGAGNSSGLVDLPFCAGMIGVIWALQGSASGPLLPCCPPRHRPADPARPRGSFQRR
jgi:hypothetical protein